MFLRPTRRTDCKPSLPRMRGGVSVVDGKLSMEQKSSPHARGCFHIGVISRGLVLVFPACAGVFLCLPYYSQQEYGLPRMRGGVSESDIGTLEGVVSSPHARGCFSMATTVSQPTTVFPACAGVFPMDKRRSVLKSSLPRMRGGVSSPSSPPSAILWSSPHARGCFYGKQTKSN